MPRPCYNGCEAFLYLKPKERREVASVTFVINRQKHLDGRSQFTILRIRDTRMDVISHHETLEQAMEAAQGYASHARFAGLDARILQRD